MKRILVVLGIVFGYTLVVECASVGAPGFLPERGRYIIGVEYNSVSLNYILHGNGINSAKTF